MAPNTDLDFMRNSILTLSTDPDVLAVLEFMQTNIEAAKLIGVAKSVAELAPSLWCRYGTLQVRALSLTVPNESIHGQQPGATK
jgi:hypothetical protein